METTQDARDRVTLYALDTAAEALERALIELHFTKSALGSKRPEVAALATALADIRRRFQDIV